MKKLKKSDFLFVMALSLALLFYLSFLLITIFYRDEYTYAVIPFRLINGESLIKDEWHLTQFSSLFTYLPISIWTAIKGSTEGIFLFLRYLYLSVHTVITVLIYGFFRKYGNWAVAASMIFFVQMPHRMFALSYQSLLVIFLLLFSFCLISICKKQSTITYIAAGVCFACCCVCNPFLCVVFAVYLLACILWQNQEKAKEFIISRKISKEENKRKRFTNKQKKELKKELEKEELFSKFKKYDCFFSKNALLFFSVGIIIIAVIAIVFYFSTGGKLSYIPWNIENLFGSSEYDAFSKPFDKFIQTIGYFNQSSLVVGWFSPALFIVLLLDKNRTADNRRKLYLSVALIMSIVHILGILSTKEFYACANSLPFFVFSSVCYLLTKNKNKKLFYCMYLPGLIVSVLQYLAANTQLAVFGLILVVNNVAGVLFAMDLFKEMKVKSTNNDETADTKKSHKARYIIIIAICAQMIFSCVDFVYKQSIEESLHKVTSGPCAGLYLQEREYNKYNKSINDLDVIKSRCREDAPVLLISYNNWMYLYLDQPIAIYTTWYTGFLDEEQLYSYYKDNTKKMPKYIYIEADNLQGGVVKDNIKKMEEFFTFTREDLSNGVLLTVKYNKIQ